MHNARSGVGRQPQEVVMVAVPDDDDGVVTAQSLLMCKRRRAKPHSCVLVIFGPKSRKGTDGLHGRCPL